VQEPLPAPTVRLVDRLAGIPGFDAELGLRFCGNREESLLLVLQQFDALYGRSATTLVDEVTAGNRREAHRLTHSLNGASGVIGAERIQKLAAALEVALATRRNDAEVTTAAEQLQFALGALIQALRERIELVAAAPLPAQRAAPSPASVALEARLDELEGLLGDADFGAGALYRQHADAIRRLLGSSAQTFEQHLRAYDYLHALDCLRAARARATA
jgi:HPt (histidine-containing phosphotransfer) domain-containing protein